MANSKELSLSPADANATVFSSLTFSPDGKTIASIGPSDPISVWDARSGKLLRRFPSHPYLGVNVGGRPTFLPGGKALALSLYGHLNVWNLEDGKPRFQTKGSPFDMQTPGVDGGRLLFSQCSVDEHTLVATMRGEVKIERGQINQGGRPQPRMEVCLAKIGLFDIRTGKIVRSFQTRADEFLQLACTLA